MKGDKIRVLKFIGGSNRPFSNEVRGIDEKQLVQATQNKRQEESGKESVMNCGP